MQLRSSLCRDLCTPLFASALISQLIVKIVDDAVDVAVQVHLGLYALRMLVRLYVLLVLALFVVHVADETACVLLIWHRSLYFSTHLFVFLKAKLPLLKVSLFHLFVVLSIVFEVCLATKQLGVGWDHISTSELGQSIIETLNLEVSLKDVVILVTRPHILLLLHLSLQNGLSITCIAEVGLN